MRLLTDLFACQSASRFRGIGRYALSLIKEMAELRRVHEMTLVANALYPDSFEALRQEFIRLLPAGSLKPYFHPGHKSFEGQLNAHDQISEALIRQVYQTLSPDVSLYPSIFEGWCEQGVVPLPRDGFPTSLKVAIVYDFIPLIFANRYLDPNPDYKKWYELRLKSYQNFDLLLAISESTRQDAITLLNISPDRVVNISTASSAIFTPLEIPQDKGKDFLSKFGITRPFVFYPGNVEYHKNLETAVSSFGRLPSEIKSTHQLVFTKVGDEAVFRHKIHSYGLTDEDIVITGYINDEELVNLYNLCKLLFFPSLYEGFGLPVLEAMACGTPVITANNSSLPEVVGREDAMFDASNTQSVTKALKHALIDEPFRQELSAYGLERAKQFGWKNSAKNAWSAIEDLQKDKQRRPYKNIWSKGKKRLRIAYVSPFPPQKSGIADYSADLLPFLAHHFEIDIFTGPDHILPVAKLKDNFNCFHYKELYSRRDIYDTVVYQVGNSEFHTHMIQLLREIPGVVVMHDFYLSNLPYVNEFLNQVQGSFLQEMKDSHGLKGMVDYVKSGVDSARRDWPIIWQVIKYAQELIVHSNNQNELLSSFYKNGWMPKTSIIKQIRQIGPEISTSQRTTIRKQLSIEDDTFVYCSFGFIAPTKLTHIIIQAFAELQALAENCNTLLILVGELEGGDYGRQILQLLDELHLKEHVLVTGYISSEDYQKYLIAADVSIQLRTDSRGETSRAVLDSLAHSLPTIINAHGTLNDYDANVVIKLPDQLTTHELCEAMNQLQTNDNFRKGLGKRAKEYIVDYHNPEKIAEAYADVIYQAAFSSERQLFASVTNSLVELRSPEDLLNSISTCAAKNLNLRSQPRILIDVSDIAKVDWRGGIQRVVKKLTIEMFAMMDKSLHLELVRLVDKRLIHAYRFSEKILNLPEGSLGEDAPVGIQPGDTLFMLDASWGLYEKFIPIYNGVRAMGGKIVTLIHDLIPLRFPETCHQVVLDVFEKWFITAASESDELVCVSRSVAEDVIQYISEKNIPLPHKLDIAFSHNGADIKGYEKGVDLCHDIKKLINEKNTPLFLMIGTIEPRKGHSFVLDAFDQIWKQGLDYRLCIIGKTGWNVDNTLKRIEKHPELGKRLFYIENGTDVEVEKCYQIATALITASIAEGFGLPIVEAAQHNLPVLASNIPVFHEVGGEGAMFFSLDSPNRLVDEINKLLKMPVEERKVMANKIKIITWRESAERMIEILKGKHTFSVINSSK
jgi:glycosyltransferase involved in cell wall biosynthesis